MKKPAPGTVVSCVAHGAILAYALIGFSSAKPYASMEPLPVEVISLSEFDQLTKGVKTSKVVDTPKVEAKKIAAANPDPKPPMPEAKQDVEAPPPPPAPEVKAETPPEPPKPEPKKVEAPPPPPTPAPKPAELPKPPEKKVDEQSQAKLDDIIKKEVQKKPEPKKVEKKPDAKPQLKFDPSKIAALADKRDPGRVAQAAPELANVTTAGISRGTAAKLSLSEMNMINAMIVDQVSKCWSPPFGAAGTANLDVVVQFRMLEDGSLQGEPEVTNSNSSAYFQPAVDAALRAVRQCAPLKLPPQYFDTWKFVSIKFNPLEMMGG